MRFCSCIALLSTSWLLCVPHAAALAQEGKSADKSISVVSNIKVLSNHVADVSSVEAWRSSFLKPGMTDRERAMAVWDTVVRFRHQDTPPREFLHEDLCVHDSTLR